MAKAKLTTPANMIIVVFIVVFMTLSESEVSMQYRKNKIGEDISLLGCGCMRFTRKGAGIDIDKAEKEIRLALEGGVNYFDTAYVYPGNEAALGEILRRIGCRKNVNIATKLPHYLIKSMDGIEKMFEEQLKRLHTDYIDYYLMHMLTDTETWENLKKLGIEKWIEDKKKSGKNHPNRKEESPMWPSSFFYPSTSPQKNAAVHCLTHRGAWPDAPRCVSSCTAVHQAIHRGA